MPFLRILSKSCAPILTVLAILTLLTVPKIRLPAFLTRMSILASADGLSYSSILCL